MLLWQLHCWQVQGSIPGLESIPGRCAHDCEHKWAHVVAEGAADGDLQTRESRM